MKYGTFAKAPEDAKDSLADALVDFLRFLREEFDLTAFPCFGTLIGILRSEDFIPGDHDIDVCYISQKQTRAEVRQEFEVLVQEFRDRGLLGRRLGTGQCSVFRGPDRAVFDLFTCWIEDGKLWSPQWGPLGRTEEHPSKYRKRRKHL